MGSRIGTAAQIDGSAGDGSTSVTVPADATGAVAFWAHWDGNTASTLSSLTLNGVSFTIQSQLPEGATTDEAGVGAATLPNPATGAQTVAWTWSAGGARTEGGEIVLVWVKDVNTGNLVRSAATDAGTSTGNVEVTLSTEVSDLLLAFAMSFSPTAPVLIGSAVINDATLNSHIYDLSEVTPNAATTTVTMTNESFSVMAAIALRNTIQGVPVSPNFSAFPKPKLAA